MRYIFIQLCIACLVLTARAQKSSQQLPLRTSDPAVREIAVNPVLPIKSGGGGAVRQAGAAKAELPIKSGDNAQRAKSQQETAVPLRKTDPASGSGAGTGGTPGGAGTGAAGGAGGAAQNQTQGAKSQPAVQLPSSLPVKAKDSTATSKISP